MAMHQIRFRLGLRHKPRWGAYSAPPDPLAGFNGPTSKGRGGEKWGEGREEREGEGMAEEGRAGQGRGRSICLPPRFDNPGYGPVNPWIKKTGTGLQAQVDYRFAIINKVTYRHIRKINRFDCIFGNDCCYAISSIYRTRNSAVADKPRDAFAQIQ